MTSRARTLSRRRWLAAGVSALTASAFGFAATAPASAGAAVAPGSVAGFSVSSTSTTATPIKHLVVIFDENVSFDHYFATYPKAPNSDGTAFYALPYSPKVNNLASAHLLTQNPNLYAPQRLSPAQAATCDQNHNYLPEQKAADGGKMDKFVQNVSVDKCSGGLFGEPGLSMDYYDGNTVTAMWNYAQFFSMSDNFFGSAYGPSSPGAIELVSGQTHGVRAVTPDTLQPTTDAYAVVAPDANGVGTMINDPDPAYDDCSNKNRTGTNNLAEFGGKNVGNLLNNNNVTWGWFQGGFAPTTPYAGSGTHAVCGASHDNLVGAAQLDYSPHHNPFSYYASTANPHHLPPSSVAMIGHTDQANHNYDLTAFDTATKANNLPSVSFLKAPAYQDGHAGYSDPLDEQTFLVKTINEIQASKQWSSTAIVLAYDDSDGWYDHVYAPLKNGSTDAANNDTACLAAASTVGVAGGYQDRCGPGPRLPLLVISPFSKVDYIDHTQTEQTSITRFIEDNWKTGRIGDASFDARAASLTSMFDFSRPVGLKLQLKSNGSVRSIGVTCTVSSFC